MSAEKLGRAIVMAACWHEGQLYAHEPYILHPIRVMQRVMRTHPGDWELAMIAVLHDVIEDGDPDGRADREDLIREAFGARVCEAVMLLSRTEGEPYEHYIARVNGHRDAKVVKIADLRENLGRGARGTLSLADRYSRALDQLGAGHG